MESTSYNLIVKGKQIVVSSNGATYTATGLGSEMWFDNDSYELFYWDDERDDNHLAYYDLKPVLIKALKKEKALFLEKLKSALPQIRLVNELNAATIQVEFFDDVDINNLIPALTASAVALASFNTALLILITNDTFSFEFSINANVYRLVLASAFYQVTQYEDSYKTLFNNQQTKLVHYASECGVLCSE